MPARKKPGLYANIHAKQERIAHGSGEKMRKPGSEGAPTQEAFDQSAKTAKKPAAKKTATRKAAAKKTPVKKAAAKKTAAKRSGTAKKSS